MLKVTLFGVIIELLRTNKAISALIWSCLIWSDHCSSFLASFHSEPPRKAKVYTLFALNKKVYVEKYVYWIKK